MKTTPATPADIARSVLAVPPLARHPDFSLNREQNAKLLQHIEAAGVSSFLYGGNANFYNVGLYEYAEILDFLAETVGPNTWVVPSVGPDYGKMMDQLEILRSRQFPTVMVLPAVFPATRAGVELAIERFVDAWGKPVVVYLKHDSYLAPGAVQRLTDRGAVAAIKYAIVRADPKQDPYLTELTQVVDRKLIFSGIGERPAVVHLRDFGLHGFTSGSVCVAPRGSARILERLEAEDWEEAEALRARFLSLETLRDEHSPICVLHEAITLAGIADMGPLLPNLSGLDDTIRARVKPVATELLGWDRAL